jgi:hypothetical protein
MDRNRKLASSGFDDRLIIVVSRLMMPLCPGNSAARTSVQARTERQIFTELAPLKCGGANVQAETGMAEGGWEMAE